MPACRQWLLPHVDFHGLRDSLHYETQIKRALLRHAQTALFFSERKVDSNLVAWNRVILLHGPPGTGKTSLCKALSQKLAVRLCASFQGGGRLVEINAHSLFSKWFSESGKLVSRLFARIRKALEDRDSFMCVLIDEVESLCAARQAAMRGSDPSDSIRVVNALLTQLDALKHEPNCLILTTSNITGAIDAAFVDRADLKILVGNPGLPSRFEILRQAVCELITKGVIDKEIESCRIPEGVPEVSRIPEGVLQGAPKHCPWHESLLKLARQCEGLSGRILRKLPFLAFSQLRHVHCFEKRPPVSAFLEALEVAIDTEKTSREDLRKSD
eukprot:Polyplicarium_translucidae@DN4475_c0_g1_i1.p1